MVISKAFFQQSALTITPQLLGTYLVHQSPVGRIAGMIYDVEAYPAQVDNVSHGNKRTNRTEVMYRTGGYAYIYIIYGIHHQFAIVVNKAEIPEVVFIRAVIPTEGISIMRQNFGRPVKTEIELTQSPGSLCKAFGINLDLYGEPIPGPKMWIEKQDTNITPTDIINTTRVGIKPNIAGSQNKFRFYLQEPMRYIASQNS